VRRNSFLAGFSASIRDELIDQADFRWDMGESLADSLEHGLPFLEHQPILLDRHEQCVSWNDTELVPDRRWNYQAALRTDSDCVLAVASWHGLAIVPD